VEIRRNIVGFETSSLRVLLHGLRRHFTTRSEVEYQISDWLDFEAFSKRPQRRRFLVKLSNPFHGLPRGKRSRSPS
jgi:hypothetical protein